MSQARISITPVARRLKSIRRIIDRRTTVNLHGPCYGPDLIGLLQLNTGRAVAVVYHITVGAGLRLNYALRSLHVWPRHTGPVSVSVFRQTPAPGQSLLWSKPSPDKIPSCKNP